MEYSERLELLIGGSWRAGSSGLTEPVYNPVNNLVIANVPHASADDLDEALAASATGFETWRSTPAAKRQVILGKTADLLDERKQQIALTLTLEQGKPLAESRLELGAAIGVLRFYSEEGKRLYGRQVPAHTPNMRQTVLKEPVGPALAFIAWNFPALNFMRKVGGALGAGCSMIIKPSEETPGTAVAIGRAFMDAGLPDGVLNIVFGVPADVSSHLLRSPVPKKLSFTGSVPVGIHLQKLAADTVKRCTLELGGHGPVLISADAEIEKAAKQSVASKFRNAGQVCVSPTRFIIEEAVYDRFVECFVETTQSLKVGDGTAEDVNMGPLASPRRLDAVDEYVQDAINEGADLLTGGRRLGNEGNFYAPTVLGDVPLTARLMEEEPFGPIAPMIRVPDFDAALAEANRLPFGLAAYAFTSSQAKAAAISSQLNTGMLGINSFAIASPELPFGGVNHSGYGSEGGIEGLDAYLRTKLVTETFF